MAKDGSSSQVIGLTRMCLRSPHNVQHAMVKGTNKQQLEGFFLSLNKYTLGTEASSFTKAVLMLLSLSQYHK